MSRFWQVLLWIAGAAAVGGVVYGLRRLQETPDYPAAADLLRYPEVDTVVERTDDNRYRIRWSVPAGQVTLYSGTAPDTTDTLLTTVSGASEIVLGNPTPSQPRYFRLVFAGGERDGAQVITAERDIHLAGAVNFRDVGGYRTRDGRYVRWGRVYRAGQLSSLTDGDIDMLHALGLQISCDFRLPEEVEEDPDRLPAGTRHELIPVQSEQTRSQQFRRLLFARGRVDQFMRHAYTKVIVDNNAHVYAQVFALIADEKNLPLVMHCTAGKDRAGVGTALLLGLLGVPDDVIAADYSLSNRYFDAYVTIGEKAIQSVGRLGLSVETLLPLFTADPQTMLITLAYIRENYGSIERYLMTAGGVRAETLAQVKANMLR